MRIDPPDLKGLKPGEAGEEWVTYLYRKCGHDILARNFEIFWKKKIGEIDIICSIAGTLIMVEVKTRKNEAFMPLEDTVNYHKQSRLRRMAKLFVQKHPQYGKHRLQIDLALVTMDPFDNFIKSVKLIENAIEDA